MAREMYLAGVPEEEMRPDPKPEKPKTPKEKRQNFWYHYKWATLAAVCTAVLLTVMLLQTFTQKKPDYTLLLITEKPYSDEALRFLEQSLAADGKDVNGDGTVRVEVVNCYLDAGGTDTRAFIANSQMLQARLAAYNVMLFAFEPEKYTWLIGIDSEDGGGGTSLFVPLGDADTENGGVYWELKKADGAPSPLPESLFFAVRALPDNAGETAKTAQSEARTLLSAYRNRAAS